MAKNESELSQWEEALKQKELALNLKSREAVIAAETDKPRDFYIAEYNSLRAEILQTITDSRNLERNIVFAFAVSLAWIMSHKNLHPLVWFVPLAASVGPGGWEEFRKDKSLGISVTAHVFWALMLLASIFVIVKKPTVTSDSSPTMQIINQGPAAAACDLTRTPLLLK